MIDAVECKLFGIGSESYVVGSHEFYMGYAISRQKWLCLDAGHFHPTESISDKLSAVFPWVPGILLHVSRGIRWDSDHVTILSDDLRAITEEAMEDNLYDSLSSRYTKSLARAMAYTKQVKAAYVLNNAFTGGPTYGDGVVLCSTAHPLVSGGTNSNRPTTGADLNETSLENAVIQIAGWTDERGLLIAAKPKKLVVPPALMFVATRLLETELRVGTTDNDINALKNNGSIPEGYRVNHFLTDTNAWFLTTDSLPFPLRYAEGRLTLGSDVTALSRIKTVMNTLSLGLRPSDILEHPEATFRVAFAHLQTQVFQIDESILIYPYNTCSTIEKKLRDAKARGWCATSTWFSLGAVIT